MVEVLDSGEGVELTGGAKVQRDDPPAETYKVWGPHYQSPYQPITLTYEQIVELAVAVGVLSDE